MIDARDLADKLEAIFLNARLGKHETVELEFKTVDLLHLAQLLRRTKRERGDRSLTTKERRIRAGLIEKALRRKQRLIVGGMRPGKAEEEAAKWLAGKRANGNLSASTWRRLMQCRKTPEK